MYYVVLRDGSLIVGPIKKSLMLPISFKEVGSENHISEADPLLPLPTGNDDKAN